MGSIHRPIYIDWSQAHTILGQEPPMTAWEGRNQGSCFSMRVNL